MDKTFFIEKVQDLTSEDGIPPGQRQFYKLTGLRESDWKNKHWNHWNNWGDVLEEAGYSRRIKSSAFERSHILRELASLTKKLGKFPVTVEMRREKRTNSNFPNDGTLSSIGSRKEVLSALLAFCKEEEDEFIDLVDLLQKTTVSGSFKPESTGVEDSDGEDESKRGWGFVYLIRARDVFKIGSTRAPYRRASEIANQSAFGAELLHLISTDDPEGIERYWHSRFQPKRIIGTHKESGEWFSLTNDDMKVFRRRKTM
jgi:hypothetical protein